MQITNGKVVPAFQPELIKAALAFMQRAQLSGQEAATFVASCDLLAAIAQGDVGDTVGLPGINTSPGEMKDQLDEQNQGSAVGRAREPRI
jgi:hypothetical protein